MAITYLKSLRNSIEKLSKWESTGKAFGFIDGVSDKNPDYIYEFFCAMKILKDLAKNHKIKLVPGQSGFKFPQKPGDKVEWAKFLIQDKTTKKKLFQFCLGVKIKISASPLTTFGADISFQKANASNDPYETDMILIMDAKYKKKNDTKLDIGTIREFAQCVKDMNVPKGIRGLLQFNKLVDLQSNCLFTNGEGNALHKQYCKNNKLKQVGRFDCDGRTMDVIG